MANARTLTLAPAGHPFRRSLALPNYRLPRNEDYDLKLFVLSFTAFFICIYGFIS